MGCMGRAVPCAVRCAEATMPCSPREEAEGIFATTVGLGLMVGPRQTQNRRRGTRKRPLGGVEGAWRGCGAGVGCRVGIASVLGLRCLLKSLC